MENYIVINGKKAELTDEQLKQLGINVEVKKETPFARHSDETYWFIKATNTIASLHDYNRDFDNALYNNVNHFNDYNIAEQVALHQLLYRKLLKYAYENDAVVNDWNDLDSKKYLIVKSIDDNKFHIDWNHRIKHVCSIYFNTKEVAEQAIENVVKPFMKEHPHFVW